MILTILLFLVSAPKLDSEGLILPVSNSAVLSCCMLNLRTMGIVVSVNRPSENTKSQSRRKLKRKDGQTENRTTILHVAKVTFF